ncbi:MAG: fluoride efflux transporter CrcB [Nitrospinae bacterium]|nr:fluoride efflux transporter CrcB [Nitrospinota bacterium]
MSLYGFAAVGAGAALGAWLRWWFGMLLNPVFPTIPLGTLAANLIGGLLIGSSMELFARHTYLPPEARLFIITGFLGGLTTFSTFSGEITALLQRQEYTWFGAAIFLHVAGSLAMTILGIFAVRFILLKGTV